MALTYNIDARGKRARFIIGVVLLGAGVGLLLLWAIPAGSSLAWIVTVICLVVGAFVVFEARAGWCAIRAMGMKTRL
jgi:uncharacterized membrane protein YccC